MKWNYTVFVFCDWLVAVSKMSSRFIRVVASVRISFAFKAEYIPLYVSYFVKLAFNRTSDLRCPTVSRYLITF